MKMTRFVRCAVIAGALLLAAAGVSADSGLVRFDFEDGTLQGWKVVSGEAGKQPTGPGFARPNVRFSQQGDFFIGLYENPNLDTAKIVLQSPVFTVKANMISLLVGGGDHIGGCYVALYRAADDSEVFRETGRNTEMMARRYWDVSALKGQQVYLKIVDSETGGWGHINVDDIRELTPAEERARAAELAESERRYDMWLAGIDESSPRKVYSGKALGDVAMPLGGIGGGHISICGDGAIRQWNIFNKCNEAAMVPQSFFAIWAKPTTRPAVTKLLQQSPSEGLPAVRRVEFIGEYPIAELRYVDSDLPVRVSLKAFSPHIPMNARDSAIPAAVFEFTVQNTSAEEVRISLLSTLQNAAGYDGASPIHGTWNKGYGENTCTLISKSNARGALLDNPSLRRDARHYGTMAIAALSRYAVVTPQWCDLAALWREFSEHGTVAGAAATGPSAPGRTWNAAVAVPAVLRPAQQVTIRFVWGWHFPNHYVWWDNREGQPNIGRMYSNWFTDAGKVVEYVAASYPRLAEDTEKFRTTFYKTSLPYWMLDRISAQSSTLASTVCMWLKDGTFAGFEGTGCCPMNCTHVWNYEQQLAHLFPDLERNMRHTDLHVQQMPDGAIRHRTRLPITLPRETGPFVDGHLGCILKCYREHRLSADGYWLDMMWPRIRLAMEFVLREWDPNKDGVLVNEQWNTYDAAMYGPNTFIGTLYLGALRACEEMAKAQGDMEFAARLRGVFETGSKRLDQACWNGEYYWQIHTRPSEAEVGEMKWLLDDWPKENPDPHVNRPYGKGCHADQLLGQWWATQLDLGYLLPKERVNSALDAVMKYNWVKDFGQVSQTPRPFAGDGDPGLYNCTWPRGEKPAHDTLYSFEVWTGIEYEVAGLLLQERRIKEAYRIVKAASDRYDGVPRPPIERNPFAEVECGNHYARAMASWGMLLAAQGYRYCGPEKSIGFDPVVSPSAHSSFFTGARGWGLFSQRRHGRTQENSLALEYGVIEIKRLTLRLPDSALSACEQGAVKAKVEAPRLNGHTLQTSPDGAVSIEFAQPVILRVGEKLAVRFGWR